MSAYVYIHKFPDGKCYIGSTTSDPISRWNNGEGYSNQPKMKAAIDKYGWENVNHLSIEAPSEEVASEVETILIRMLNTIENGYNSRHGSNDSTYHEMLCYKGLYEHQTEMLKLAVSCMATISKLEKTLGEFRS